MIRGELLGGKRIIEHTSGAAGRLQSRIAETVKRLTFRLLARVKGSKLSGQVLNVRSGRLRRSINARFENPNSDKVEGIVGTNVVYARPHEYGFKGLVTVKQSLRTVKQAFGKAIAPVEVTVAAHSRKMNLPERSFLRSALADMQGEIKSELARAVKG